MNRKHLHIVGIIFCLIFSLMMALKDGLPIYSSFSHYKIYHEKVQKYTGDSKNPLPTHHAVNSILNRLYFLVLDDEYKPMPHQCLSKKLWMDEMIKDPHVDGIEWYSINHWTNTECNITPITVPPPKKPTLDPSSYLLYHALIEFTQRSKAEFLCLIGDATYIRVKPFLEFFENKTKDIKGNIMMWGIGNCIEQRYFFRMHTIESGIIVSRRAILQILKRTELWDISISLMHHSDEAFGQIIDSVGIYVPSADSSLFLGRQWEHYEDFQNMILENYSNLSKCVLSQKNLISQPGELSSCNKEITPLKEVISWAGGGVSNKTIFLQNVERIYNHLSDDIGFFWNCRHPQICNMSIN